jgi:hypothetical protein
MRSILILLALSSLASNNGAAQNSYAPAGEQALTQSLTRIEQPQTAKREVKRCAYIVILNVPEIDPKMTKEIHKEFNSNTPIMRVLPPCSEDSSSVNGPLLSGNNAVRH